jgi:hypothetical protein
MWWRILIRDTARKEQEGEDGYSRSSSWSSSRIRFRGREKQSKGK